MTGRPKTRLSLRTLSLLEPSEERDIDIGVFDLVLPCREFEVVHKVAELGHVSLTTEFILRLLKTVDGLSEDDASAFFGFSRRDMAFVLSEVEGNNYVERKDGRLWLTGAGRGLFRDGAKGPSIFEVEKRTERVGFDLIALAPQPRMSLAPFDFQLPELKSDRPDLVSSATGRVPESFRRFYVEIVAKREPDMAARRSLYSIDSVTPAERFFSLVRVKAKSSGQRPGFPEPDLSEWRSDHELQDRGPIVESAARFIEELRTDSRAGDADAFQILCDVAPEFLKEFIRRDGLAVERFYREAVVRAGDIRSDRQTAPILGSLFTRESTARLLEALKYGLESHPDRSSICLWSIPHTQHWGTTSALPELINTLEKRVLGVANADNENSSWSIALIVGPSPRHLGKAFDIVAETTQVALPPPLEVLLIPHILTAVVVHAPMPGSRLSTPVPLGLVSFDEKVVSRVHQLMSDRLRCFSLTDATEQRILQALAKSDVPQGGD